MAAAGIADEEEERDSLAAWPIHVRTTLRAMSDSVPTEDDPSRWPKWRVHQTLTCANVP
jgi:hypothetical protein